MKTGRILENRNATILERENENWDDGSYDEISMCVYSRNFAYVANYLPGSYQSKGSYQYIRYARGKNGILGHAEILDKLPKFVNL